MLDKFGVEPSEIGKKKAAVEDFDAPTERMTSIIPLLYQSGYITIKDYDEELDLYTLDIPNKEVRIGLMKSLLPYYVASKAPETNTMVAYLSRDIRNGDIDAALRRLQMFLSTIPQCDNTKYEGHWKLDKGADRAMEQINLKNYPERVALCGLPIIKIAVSFDSERCTIGEWKMEG